jgi:hypothetical protein
MDNTMTGETRGRLGNKGKWGGDYSGKGEIGMSDDEEGTMSNRTGMRSSTFQQGRNSGTKRGRRYGRNTEEDDMEDEQSYDNEGNETTRTRGRTMRGGTHQQHVMAGKKGAAARWGRKYTGGDDEDMDEDEEDEGTTRTRRRSTGRRMSRSEAGRMGAQARWGRRYSGGGGSTMSDEDDEDEEGNYGSSNYGGNYGRSFGRGQRGGTHQQHVMAGKKGAAARWGYRTGGGSWDEEDNDEDEGYGYSGGYGGRMSGQNQRFAQSGKGGMARWNKRGRGEDWGDEGHRNKRSRLGTVY